MEKHKVIQKVNKPTDWVHNLVIVEKKDGSLRLCLDPRELNKAIKRENFQIPTVEDVICRLSGKKVFTVIDLKDTFWQVPLSEESASLTTFNTPFGRYFFKRMPFGLCSAVLQKRVYQTFGDIDDVYVIADDIIIAFNGEEEADCILIKLFVRAQEKNVKFNIAKLQLKKSEVRYLGYIIGAWRAAGQDMAKYAGRGGPNDIVAGRAQLFQPAQFLSKCAHCLCLLVGGLPDR